MMDQIRNFLPFHKHGERKQREQEEQRSCYLHKNGSLLMEDLIATFGPRYKIPIRSFTVEQLIRATNNFSDLATNDFSEKLCASYYGDWYKGNLEERPVLVNYYRKMETGVLSIFIRDIVVTSQMSHHKNVLPLIGCCLELECPAMVYDNTLDHEFVSELLDPSNNGNGKLTSWRDRTRIAKDICNVLIYLHRAFPSPIIFRDLTVNSVVIDRCGAAKLVGFGLSISLPPGELKVEDRIMGTFGYLDPEYLQSNFVTEKTDVFCVGIFMMVLFAGQQQAIVSFAQGIRIHDDDDDDDEKHGETAGNQQEIMTVRYHVENCIRNNRFKKCIDPKFFEEEGRNEHQILQHLLPLSSLALRCSELEGMNRPEMIDVAKEVSQAEKCLRS